MNIKVLHDEKEIADRVAEVARTIREDAGDEEILLIGVLKRTTVFLADLIRKIPGKVHYEFIDVVTDVSDTGTASALEISFLSHFLLEGRRVYLVKDVVSTCVIENNLLAQLREKGPSNLKLVAILDRPDLRTMPLDVEYALFAVGEGTFVGYGLEHENHLGNLPYIGTV